jgi:acyl dehydratase
MVEEERAPIKRDNMKDTRSGRALVELLRDSPLRDIPIEPAAVRAPVRDVVSLEEGEPKMTGLYLEDFEVGRVFEHAIRRTVTEMDNTLFSCLTHNPQPLHIDHEFSARTEWGRPLMNSLFTLGLMIGISVNDTTLGTTIANLGMTEVRFPKPVFHGDTLRVTTEVLSRRETRSRPDAGIVEFLHKAINQKGEVVAECRRQAMMRRRPKA